MSNFLFPILYLIFSLFYYLICLRNQSDKTTVGWKHCWFFLSPASYHTGAFLGFPVSSKLPSCAGQVAFPHTFLISQPNYKNMVTPELWAIWFHLGCLHLALWSIFTLFKLVKIPKEQSPCGSNLLIKFLTTTTWDGLWNLIFNSFISSSLS